MSTPPASQSPTQHTPTDNNNDNDTSDIWATDSPLRLSHPNHINSTTTNTTISNNPPYHSHSEEVLSDLPSIRRQHMTSGYREGLSIGKARTIQSSFDQGYPIGISLGMRVGRVLGVLDGVVGAHDAKTKSLSGRGEGLGNDDGGDTERRRKETIQMLERARRELDVKRLLDGIEEEQIARAEGVEELERVEEVVGRWETEALGSSDGTTDSLMDSREHELENHAIPTIEAG